MIKEALKQETYKMMLSPEIEIPENFKENNWSFDEYMGLGILLKKTYGRVFRYSGNNGYFQNIR